MKRRIAWFMAALMCVTSVPQGSLVSKATEETEISTEAITEASSDEEVVEMAETGEAVENTEETAAEKPAETPVESEVVEIPVPDTEQQSTELIETETETITAESTETETAFSETNESETADTEEISEPMEEETEVPETLAPEKVDLETESEEKIAEQTAVLEDDEDSDDDDEVIGKISTITLSKDYTTYIYDLEYDYTTDLEVKLTYEGSDEIETFTCNGTEEYEGIWDGYDNILNFSYVDSSGNKVERNEVENKKGIYKIHVEDSSDSDVYGELEFTVADREEAVTNSLSSGNKVDLNLNKENPIWYKYSVPKTGKYLLKFHADQYMDVWLNGNFYDEITELEKEDRLEAGETYYFRVNASYYEKFTGAVELQAVPIEKSQKVASITSIKVKENEPILEDNVDIGPASLEFTVGYEDGSTQTVSGLNDNKENEFSIRLRNVADEKNIYDVKYGDGPVSPKAGTYIVEVSICYDDQKVLGTGSFTVHSVKELADKNGVLTNENKKFDKKDNESLVIFKYTATETGTWKVDFNRNLNKLKVVDETGKKILYMYEGTSYTMQLDAGKTAYFIAEPVEGWKNLRVNITKSVSVENVTMGCYYTADHPYYLRWDYVWAKDFYLDVTYSDGTTSRLIYGDKGFRDKYENRFTIYTILGGKPFDQDKNGLVVYEKWQVKAYLEYYNCLEEEMQEVASMWLPCKELDSNVLETLPEIKVGQKVKTGNSRQYYRFVPEKDGYYSLGYYNQKYHNSNNTFCERKGNDWDKKGIESVWMEKGKSYLLVIYDEEFTVLRQVDDMVQGGALELDQPADITISDSAKKINFTFTSENDETYQLKIKTVSGGKVHLYVKEYEGPSYYKVVYNRLVDSEEEVLLSVYGEEYGYHYDISVEYEEGIGSGSLTISRPNVKTVTSMSLSCSEEGPLWGVNGITSLASLAEDLNVLLRYEDGSSDTIFLWKYSDQLYNGGIIEDSYGRQYTVKIEETATVEEGETHYQFQLVYGDLTASRELILVDPQKKQDITEADGKQITVTQTDGSIAMKVFRFVPSEDGRYRINTNMNGNEKVSVQVKYNSSDLWRYSIYDAYEMEKGKEYLIALTFHQSSAGTIDVSVSNVSGKEIVDMELVSLPEDLYAVEEFWYPDLSGAKLKLICQDGTEEIRTFAYGEGIDVDVEAVDGNTCRISFEADGYVVKKDIPMLQKKDLPVLDNGKLENVRFTEQDTDSARTRIVRFNVCTDGVYQVSVTNQNGAEDYESLFVQEESAKMGEKWNPDKNGYELKSGKTYFLIIKAKGTYNISVQNTETGRDHQYEWVIVKNSSCTENGSRKEVCQFCGAEGRTEIIAAKGHTFIVKTDKAATCGAAGSQHEECSVCGKTKAAVAIPATGNHKYTVKVDRAATCGAAGSQHEECSVCGKKKTATAIQATGKHSFGAYKTVTAATVLKAGSKARTCSVCGKKETAVVARRRATIKLSASRIIVPLKKTIAGPTVTFGKGDGIKNWKSAKTSVVTVNVKTGKLTGKRVGTAKVTVTLKSGKKATVTVYVKKIITTTRLKANRTAVVLRKGKSFRLKVTVTPKNSQEKVTYKSSDSKVATVTTKGKIIARKKGKAVITITSGTKKITCRVTVK